MQACNDVACGQPEASLGVQPGFGT